MKHGFALTDVARDLERLTETGACCSECGTTFVAEHGRPTACSYCWSRLTLAEQRVVMKATHEEANVSAHKQLARENKKRKAQ